MRAVLRPLGYIHTVACLLIIFINTARDRDIATASVLRDRLITPCRGDIHSYLLLATLSPIPLVYTS